MVRQIDTKCTANFRYKSFIKSTKAAELAFPARAIGCGWNLESGFQKDVCDVSADATKINAWSRQFDSDSSAPRSSGSIRGRRE